MRTVDLLPAIGWGYRPKDMVDRFLEEWRRPFFDIDYYNEWLPPADIAETDTQYTITIEVPGIDMKATGISYDDGVLVVRGEKRKETAEDECCQCAERYAGEFERRFQVPGKIDEEKIDATYKDGILRVTLPKAAGHKARKIEIH